MNREKAAWLVSVLLLAILALQLPHGLAQRDSDYAFVRTLVDIHRQVTSNYVEPIDEQKLNGAAIDGMLGQLDPFSVYVPPAKQQDFDRMLEGSFEGVGIQLNQDEKTRAIEVVTPIEGSPAAKAGIMPGDLILKVNGESIEGQKIDDVVKRVKGKGGTQVTLTVRHEAGKEESYTLTRQEVIVPSVKGYIRKSDNTWDFYVCDDPKIAYVRISQFTPDTADKLRGYLTGLLKDGMKGLVLDLRWNPGGRLDEAVKTVDMFVDHGVIVTTRGRNRPERVEMASGQGTLPRFPMVVLVNEHSASASEIVAGSLQDNKRALVVGTRTYGKGSVQEVMPLDGNNGELKLTVAYYYLPSGRLVHKKKDATDWGVQPISVVPLDDEAQRKVAMELSENEHFRHSAKVSTKPATTSAAAVGPSTAPTTEATAAAPTAQPLDAQLQAGITSLMGYLIFEGNGGSGGNGAGTGKVHSKLSLRQEAPATQPAKR